MIAVSGGDKTVEVQWLSLPQARKQLPSGLYAHLADDGSLTRRVRETCPQQFEVRLIDHRQVRPLPAERDLLGLQTDDAALARQVFLCCGGEPRVFARTIIGLVERNRPLTSRIEHLGQQSLGSILFRDPLAEKREMHLVELPLTHGFFQGVEMPGFNATKKTWVRRSLYTWEGCDLVVYEAFIGFEVRAMAGSSTNEI